MKANPSSALRIAVRLSPDEARDGCVRRVEPPDTADAATRARGPLRIDVPPGVENGMVLRIPRRRGVPEIYVDLVVDPAFASEIQAAGAPPFRTSAQRVEAPRASVRRSALPKLFAWTAVTIAGAIALHLAPPDVTRLPFLGLAIPAAAALAYLLEFATGVPFADAERRWKALGRGMRLLIGSAVVIGTFVLLALAIGLAGATGLLR